jgi:tetratricopeptide (TPR) repeat protein
MRATNWLRLSVLALPLLLSACQSGGGKETIARLRHQQIEIKEEKIEGGLEKAMEGYRRFLDEAPDSALTPEAIRRLADLKVEKEYGLLGGATVAARRAAASLPPPPQAARPAGAAADSPTPALALAAMPGESPADFEKRAAESPAPGTVAATGGVAESDELERAGTLEAIELYKKLLNDHPAYERNDQVLYQMSRAHEELGQVEAAMEVMERLVRTYPQSRYLDEVQFRRAEYFFTRRRYLEAEAAYGSIVSIGATSSYFQLALYKLGWTFYKQDLYDEALHRFIALLDYKVSVGYDFGGRTSHLIKKLCDVPDGTE